MVQRKTKPIPINHSTSMKLEAAKLNAARAFYVVEQARDFLLDSTPLHKASQGYVDFDVLESMLCAAATLLREAHVAMTKGDEVVETPPSVL